MKHRKNNGAAWYKFLFIALVTCSFSLVAINIVVLVILPLIGKGTLNYEQTVIQNIINIFGMAVSVWIGLSIADRMDRGEILKLKEQAEELEAQLAENERINLQLFINDLQGNDRYDIAQLIIRKINEIEANTFSSGIWLAMREAEQLLDKLLNTRPGPESEIVYSQYVSSVENIRKEIEKNKNSVAVKSINEILDFRLIRARFEMGYSTDSKTANKYFIECVEFFVKKSDQFGLELSAIPNNYVFNGDEAENVLDLCLRSPEYEWSVYAYLFNFMGVSYSEIVYYNNRCKEKDRFFPKKFTYERCEILAVNFCLLAIAAAKRGKTQCETYYRNYGCTIERTNFGKLTESVLWKAVDQYKEAFRLNSGHRLVYYCIASAYNKIFEVRTGLTQRDKDKKITEINLCKYEKQKMKDFLCEYERWIELYLKCFPQEISAYRMAALFYRNKYLWNKDELSANCLREQLYVLEQMQPEIREKDEYKDGITICKKEKVL